METKYDIIIIGNGLATMGVLSSIVELAPSTKILVISDEDSFPPCSLNSTATVALNGVEKGISPLGDLLYDSYWYFDAYFKKNKFQSVEKVFHERVFLESELEKNKRRFKNLKIKKDNEFYTLKDESYIVNPIKFIEESSLIFRKNLKNLKYQKAIFTGYIENKEEIIVHSSKGNFQGSRLLLATGAWGRHYTRGKLATGQYMTWENISLDNNSFIKSFSGHNLIYLKNAAQLKLGSFDSAIGISMKNSFELEKIVNSFRQDLKLDFIPPVEQGKLSIGHRQKASKRLPYFGAFQDSSRVFTINSFYKNGYSYFLHLGNQITQLMFKKFRR